MSSATEIGVVQLDHCNLAKTLVAVPGPYGVMMWGQPVMLLWALDPAWVLTSTPSATHQVSCRVLYKYRAVVHPYETQALKTFLGYAQSLNIDQ